MTSSPSLADLPELFILYRQNHFCKAWSAFQAKQHVNHLLASTFISISCLLLVGKDLTSFKILVALEDALHVQGTILVIFLTMHQVKGC